MAYKFTLTEIIREYTHIKEEDAKEEMERLGLLNVKEA